MESAGCASDQTSSHVDGESAKAHANYREMMSTLKRDEGWGLELYEYQGFWCIETFLQGIMAAQVHFKPQPTDIIVSSFPKCGTTWLKALTFAILTRTHFSPSSTPLLTTLPHDCIPLLEIDLVQIPPKRDYPNLPLIATHIPFPSLPISITTALGCKIVYIYRDPKDAFVSAWHFFGSLKPRDPESPPPPPLPLEEAFQLFCKGQSLYGPYWDHVMGYWKASVEWPERLLLLKYEDLMRDTPFHVKRLADFLGLPFSEEEENEGAVQKVVDLCSFENLSNLDVNKSGGHRQGSTLHLQNNKFFRKGKVGDWKNHLTPEMADKIDFITKQKLGECGLMD